jgi:hypothetical protein
MDAYEQASQRAYKEALRYRESAAINRAAEKVHTGKSTIASSKAEQCEAHERTKHQNDAKHHAHLASEHGINRKWDVEQSRFFRGKFEELSDLARHHERISEEYDKASSGSDNDSDSEDRPIKKRKISPETPANKAIEQKRMLSHSVHDARQHHGVNSKVTTLIIQRAYDFHDHYPHVKRQAHGDRSHWH